MFNGLFTYIAADWDHDKDAVDALHYWNNSSKYGLFFLDAHELTQARDSSLNCSIKQSLASRLGASKTFVLIVGEHTNDVRAGGCQYCQSYNSYSSRCARGHNTDYRSYIEFECDKAVRDGLKIGVLYKSFYVVTTKCPISLRMKGTHVPMIKYTNGGFEWDYLSVMRALTS